MYLKPNHSPQLLLWFWLKQKGWWFLALCSGKKRILSAWWAHNIWRSKFQTWKSTSWTLMKGEGMQLRVISVWFYFLIFLPPVHLSCYGFVTRSYACRHFPTHIFFSTATLAPNLSCGSVLFIVSHVCSFNSAQMLIRYNGCAQLSCVIVCNSVCNVK